MIKESRFLTIFEEADKKALQLQHGSLRGYIYTHHALLEIGFRFVRAKALIRCKHGLRTSQRLRFGQNLDPVYGDNRPVVWVV
jgi:hypothetical protein